MNSLNVKVIREYTSNEVACFKLQKSIIYPLNCNGFMFKNSHFKKDRYCYGVKIIDKDDIFKLKRIGMIFNDNSIWCQGFERKLVENFKDNFTHYKNDVFSYYVNKNELYKIENDYEQIIFFFKNGENQNISCNNLVEGVNYEK